MGLNQTKFSSKTDKVAHNMAVLGFFPLIIFVWQMIMVFMGNPAGSWMGVLIFGLLTAVYWLASWLVKKRHCFGWHFAVLSLVSILVAYFVFAKPDNINSEAVFFYLIWPVVNLYVLYLLVSDRKNYFV